MFNLRLIRTVLSFWASSIESELEYRFNILIEIISVVGNLLGSIFTLSIFYGPNHNLGGWSWYEALIILGIYSLLDGFTATLLQPNLSRIVRHVQNGTLDYVLLKPISSQLWLSLRFISPWGKPSILVGLVLIVFGVINSNVKIDLLSISFAILMIISSLLILYSLWFLIATTSIWFVKVWNANEVLRSTLVASRYPLSAYPDSLRKIFTFILPIAFLTTIPAQAILNNVSITLISLTLFVSLIFFLISTKFWVFALRFYTSASS